LKRVQSILIYHSNEAGGGVAAGDLHLDAAKAFWSCSLPVKLWDLKADSRGGPNRASGPDAVELNLKR